MAELAHIIIEHLLTRARNGDTQAARELAGYGRAYLSGEIAAPMPEALRTWLVDGCAAIAAGEPADKAMLTRKGKGRGKADDLETAAEVHDSDLPRHKEPGGVYHEVGRRFAKSPSAVESIYAKWREGFEINDEVQREPAPRPCPEK